MNAHSLRVLEYEQIKTMLAGYASCELGKRAIAGLAPEADEERVRRALRETSEAQRLMDVGGGVPLGGIHDVRDAVRAAAMGSLLDAGTLLSIADTLGASRRLRTFILKRGRRRRTSPSARGTWAISLLPRRRSAAASTIAARLSMMPRPHWRASGRR
jgi:dsDNA-specific endonuclease/ATPase MutS2